MKRSAKICAAALLLLSLAARAGAGLPEPTPVFIDGAWVATGSEVKIYFDKKAAIIIDVRSRDEFEEGHIPGALNVPYFPEYRYPGELFPDEDTLVLWNLQYQKHRLIVIYGERTTDWRPYYASLSLVYNNFRNVIWYRNGLEDWHRRGLPIASGKK